MVKVDIEEGVTHAGLFFIHSFDNSLTFKVPLHIVPSKIITIRGTIISQCVLLHFSNFEGRGEDIKASYLNARPRFPCIGSTILPSAKDNLATRVGVFDIPKVEKINIREEIFKNINIDKGRFEYENNMIWTLSISMLNFLAQNIPIGYLKRINIDIDEKY